MTERRIIAKFHPQAWVNDYAVSVDPEGNTEWDVTDEILAMGKVKAIKLRDDDYNTDRLTGSPNAPQWIQDWGGPFYVEVEDSIAKYYDQ